MSAVRPDQPIRDSRGKIIAHQRFRTIEQIERMMSEAISYRDTDNKRARAGSMRGSESFTGTANIEEYRDMLRDGWSAGVEGVTELDGLSTDRADKLQFVRNVGGAFPVVPAFLQGQPDAMLMPTPMPADSVRGLTLVVNAAFNCNVTSETVLDYAREVMKLVAWLQAEQIETSVYITIPLHLGGKKFVYTTPIREAGEIFQPERIAAILHPSFLRRAYFAMLEHEHYVLHLKGAQACSGGYGSARTIEADEIQQVLPEAYSVIMLPRVGASDPMRAVKESITLKLKQQG